MLKSIEAIKLDITKKKRNSFHKQALLVVQTYDESYIISEIFRLKKDVKKLKGCIHPKDFYGMNGLIKSEIRLLNRKLRMLKYLIV